MYYLDTSVHYLGTSRIPVLQGYMLQYTSTIAILHHGGDGGGAPCVPCGGHGDRGDRGGHGDQGAGTGVQREDGEEEESQGEKGKGGNQGEEEQGNPNEGEEEEVAYQDGDHGDHGDDDGALGAHTKVSDKDSYIVHLPGRWGWCSFHSTIHPVRSPLGLLMVWVLV